MYTFFDDVCVFVLLASADLHGLCSALGHLARLHVPLVCLSVAVAAGGAACAACVPQWSCWC